MANMEGRSTVGFILMCLNVYAWGKFAIINMKQYLMMLISVHETVMTTIRYQETAFHCLYFFKCWQNVSVFRCNISFSSVGLHFDALKWFYSLLDFIYCIKNSTCMILKKCIMRRYCDYFMSLSVSYYVMVRTTFWLNRSKDIKEFGMNIQCSLWLILGSPNTDLNTTLYS